MADVIHVDYDVLDQAHARLLSITDELQNAEHHRDAIRGAVGHSGLADAMKDFTDDWDRHRRQLVEELQGFGDALAKLTASFRAEDESLSRSISSSGQSTGGGR